MLFVAFLFLLLCELWSPKLCGFVQRDTGITNQAIVQPARNVNMKINRRQAF